MPDAITPAAAVTKPCIIEMPAEIYHGLPTPEPALSAGFAIRMLNESPARAWFNSPMNPAYVEETKPAFDIGKATHLLFLEPELYKDKVVIIAADDYRTALAKEKRDEAYAFGLVPLLTHQAEMVQDMRLALMNRMRDLPFATAPEFAVKGLAGGRAEISMFWRHPQVGIWCKARPDYLRDRMMKTGAVIVDYKTTAVSPGDLERHAFGMSWHQRAAHYIDGYQALTGERADYWFISQEKTAPYFVTVCRLDDEAIEWGRQMNLKAAWEFSRCLRSGRWPSGTDSAITIRLPAWAQKQLQDRHDRGDFDVDHRDLAKLQAQFKQAIDAFAPL